MIMGRCNEFGHLCLGLVDIRCIAHALVCHDMTEAPLFVTLAGGKRNLASPATIDQAFTHVVDRFALACIAL